MTTKTADFPAPLKALTLITLVVVLTSSPCLGVNVVDLTHVLKQGESISWPTNPDFNFTIMLRGRLAGFNVRVESNKFEMPEHMGTHMDAPSHVGKGGKLRMHQIPPERLMGPGVVVDVRDKVTQNPLYSVTVDDLKEWESQHGRMPDKAVVLVNAGWASRYPDWNKVFGTEDLRDVTSFKFPRVSAEAAQWLAEERNINALGIDTPTPDTGNDFRLPVHLILLPRGILILENVANLNQLPPTGTTIVLGALNIHDGSGAPMRMLAFSRGCWLHSTSPLPLALTAAVVVVSMGISRLRRLSL